MSSLFSGAAAQPSALDDLIATIATLLGDEGCEWDHEQTHQSLAKYLIEETYETVDAIGSGNLEDVKEELGDVLYQVLFHAQIAKRDGEGFDIQSIAAATNAKMRGRHPHVFGDEKVDSIADIQANWQRIKAVEKAERTSVLDGIPQSLPALALADKVLGRARSLGLLGDGSGVLPLESEQEVGRMLLSIVATASAAGIDAEQALRATVRELQGEVREAESALSDGGVVGVAAPAIESQAILPE